MATLDEVESLHLETLDKELKEPANGYDENERVDDTESLQRETWGGRFEFLFSVLGFTFGLGNIWRFPYFVYRNGGGVALIPYLLFLITCGSPLYYIEICLGQFSGKSPNGVWEICPLFKGLGVLMAIVSTIFVWYFGLCFGWAWYFLFHSFNPTLPWSTCNNTWNSPHCIDGTTNVTERKIALNISDGSLLSTSATEFWINNVLVLSSGIDDMGSVQLHIFGCIVLGWILVFLCLVKGIRSLGKVVYVTATMPFILLTVLVVRGATLDGASDGLKKYMYPDFSKLLGHQVWIEAAVQCFFSLGPAWGAVITMASFNKFNHNIIRDTVIVCVADGFTGFYSGLVVFSVLGFLSKETGTPFEDLPFSGASLAFIAYPEALSRLPLPNVWSVLFFLTLLFVGIDSAFGTFETATSFVIDINYSRLNKYRTPITAAIILVIVVLSIPLSMSGGYYVFMLVDWYIATFTMVVCALLECIIVAWIYGAARFSFDIEMMQGKRPPLVIRLIWGFVIPSFLSAILIATAINYSAPYNGKGGYTYPGGAVIIGNLIAFGPLACVFLIAVWQIANEKQGSLMQRIKRLARPSDKWVPNDTKMKEIYRCQPYMYTKKHVVWDKIISNNSMQENIIVSD